MLLKLGAAELPVSLGLPLAVAAEADDALQAQQEDPPVAVAEHCDLQHTTHPLTLLATTACIVSQEQE